MSVDVVHGSCPEALAAYPDGSFDAVVTDPPYGLSKEPDAAEVLRHWLAGDDYEHRGGGFMGKSWDSFVPGPSVWRECWRVLKPGGHLLAFGGTRTFDLLTIAIRLAGFEIRDEILNAHGEVVLGGSGPLAWVYGSGFPKSLDVSKAIDKARDDTAGKLRVTSWFADVADARGVTRADVDAHMGTSDMGGWWLSRLGHRCAVPTIEQIPRLLEVLGVAPDEVPDEIGRLIFELNGRKGQPGEAWFRREVVGTKRAIPGVAFSSQGPTELEITAPATPEAERWQGFGTALKPAHEPVCLARKPLSGTVAANVLEHGTGALNIDGCRGKGDAGNWASYEQPPGSYGTPDGLGRWPANVVLDEEAAALLDQQSGTSTSRVGKPRGAASGDGCDPTATGAEYADSGGASRFFYVAKAAKHERPRLDDGTAHSTVKPVALMRWLVRLVTPPGGLVLDPFAGSGTTGEACVIEGFRAVLIEQDEAHVRMIEQRLAKPTQISLLSLDAS